MSHQRWNATGEATFEHVRFAQDGAPRILTFYEFFALPVDRRVRILLEGRPTFWARGAEIAKAKALARRA